MFKNILVNALVNLGDVVLTTSALALIKKNFPDTKITMLVKPVVKDAVIDNPVVDDVIVLDYKAKENSFQKMRELVKEIRRRNFDLAISFDRKLRPALITFLARIPCRVGPSKVFDDNKSRVTLFYTDVVEISHDLNQTLQAETYQEIVRKFFKIEGHAEPVFPKKNSPVADKLLARLPKAEFKIALCVKGTFPLKTWSKEYFAEVVRELKKSFDAAFFIVGAPNDKDYADEVIKEIGGGVENFCGETSLTDLAELFRRADLFITVDTGATHIAATTGVKMITMYGCTSPDRWHPINKNAVVLTSRESCCPCTFKAEQCPTYPKPACLQNVTPAQVLDAAKKFLSDVQQNRLSNV
ncbi:MAG: glycosyltransferase family 9 protein [Selenomonadaceae bacterium]|nr:glycosyltransferase family 9 protein [Selenomonadaceae bacterium]